MKKSLKYTAVLLLAALCLMLFAGCGEVQLIQPKADEGVTPIKLEGTCVLQKDSVIRVYTHSNLMDGAVVKFTLDSFNGVELASQTYTKKGDDIYAEFSIDPSWKGMIYGSMVCIPDDQPAEVKEKYGKKFQNIQGENVIWDTNGNIFVLQSEKFDLG